MAHFFIDRPIFAWVIALAILIGGLVALTQLPVYQYPTIAPPSVIVSASYPGASAHTLDETVVSVIEDALNGVDDLIYMESVSEASGTARITLTFEPGTDPDMAQVDVQNKLSRATPRLPAAVTQQGVQVDKASGGIMMAVSVRAREEGIDPVALGDYVARNVLPELQRLPGVGVASLRGSEHAMRIWVDPNRLVGYGLSYEDVNRAIREQNVQIPAGALANRPTPTGQTLSATIMVPGQLATEEAFGDIILRANRDGSTVRLKDVARVELGAQEYAITIRSSGSTGVLIAIELAPGGNALETSAAVQAKMEELSSFFPSYMEYAIPYDTSRFARASIYKVVTTLLEAVALVFLVIFLFLQNLRYTVIPVLVVPIALAGTLGVLWATGFSVNMLTMFAMVLAIGILVDDAIVVVENVERIMAEEGLSPRLATRKAMSQITGAIIGITVVLVSVFIPMAMFAGSVGNIYRQFSITMATSILFSAFMALSLTPALCATLLRPRGAETERRGFFGLFNRAFHRSTTRYQHSVRRLLGRTGRYLVIYGALVAAAGLMMLRLPTGFLPSDDQGTFFVATILPPGATDNRTAEVMEQIDDYLLAQPEVRSIESLVGFSIYGQGQNAAHTFVSLRDWSERRRPEESMFAVIDRTNRYLADLPGAVSMAIALPPIIALGNASGVTARLQDRASQGHGALREARLQLLALANESPVLRGARAEGLDDEPQLQVDIDRDKAAALGIPFSEVSSAVATAIGSTYVNDFPNAGRMQRVVVQSDTPFRGQPGDILAHSVINADGDAIPLATIASARWISGPKQVVRYNGYPAQRITAEAAPGYSSGDAMAELERLMEQLPPGFNLEWTGQSREERISGSQAPLLLGFSLLAVFLCLAALYESWSIPLGVILAVPLGVIGSLLAATSLGMPNDVYFKVGLIAIIGLASKNAILIIEFARERYSSGMELVEATVEACRMRLRPIIMTSLAFTLGVTPLALATGAGAAAQRAIGIGVVGGMLSATVLAIFLVPVFFVTISRRFPPRRAMEE